MIATTRLLTTASVVSTVICRSNTRVLRTIHPRELKIIRMIYAPLRHLLFRNLDKSSSTQRTLLVTCVDLVNSMLGNAIGQASNWMVMRESPVPFCESRCDRPEPADKKIPLDISEKVVPVDDNFCRDSMNFIDLGLIMGPGSKRSQEPSMTKQKYKAIRQWKPLSSVQQPVNPDTHFVVKVLSYNILAQILLDNHIYLYWKHDKQALNWEKRKALLHREILKANANVICLQEVQDEHLEDFVAVFEEAGYDYLYKKRTNDKRDGLLLLYRKDQFKLVDHTKLELYQSGVDILNRDNVAIIAKFSLVESPHTHVVISTTHLLYNPQREDVRLAQTQVLLAELDRLAYIKTTSKGPKYHPIILSGDFNLQPHTGVYKFITEGLFAYSDKSRTLKAGSRSLGKSLIPPCLLVTDNCQHLNLLTKRVKGEGDGTTMLDNMDEKKQRSSLSEKNKAAALQNDCGPNPNVNDSQIVNIIDGLNVKFSSGILTHPFKLNSLYKHKNACGEEEATTNQGEWITVDYIFYHGMEPIDKYTLPTVSECETLPTIPNSVVGSDHLCIGASFKLLKKAKR